MIHLKLPFETPRRLAFYLAMEEWAARCLPAGDYFFSWRVNPTVICGRNQEMDKEVNMAYCRENGIDVVRRRSGGGCVYADMDNFMFSYVCPGDEVTVTFSRYTTMLAAVLRKLGLDAAATGRNDILISGRKVSGNAFYHLSGRCIAHGTMLYDFDPSVMGKAITPSRAKLESKSVKSVQSRVTCLKEEGISLNHEQFEKFVISELCSDEIILSADDVKAVETIEQTYYDPDYLYRKGELSASVDENETGIIRRQGRIEGVGEMDFTIKTDDKNRVVRVAMSGDVFLSEDPEKVFLNKLEGVEFNRKAVELALDGVNPGDAVVGLNRELFLDIIFPPLLV